MLEKNIWPMKKTMTFDIRSIVKVYDGDTLTVMLDRGFHDYSQKDVRLSGIDTPEKSYPTKAQGQKVRDAVEKWLHRQTTLTLLSFEVEPEKYGRVLGDVIGIDSLCEWLLLNRLAKKYDGGTKAVWTPEELKTVDAFEVK